MPVSTEVFDRLAKRIDSYRDEMVEFQKELTAIVALGPENGGQGEWPRARFLQEKIRSLGLGEITEYNAPDERVPEGTRPNMVVRVEGDRPEPTVWVMAHMDVVPPGDLKLWSSDPFQVIEKEGRLFGRGVEDNQQGLVSALYALKALRDEGVKPSSDVALILVSDEETGNLHGIDHVLRSEPDLVKPTDLVIVPDAGNPDGSMVEVAEKSILWVEFTVKGKQVHASMPHAGINSHRAAAHLTVRLDETLHGKYGREDPVFDPPRSSFEPTQRDANVPNVNTIPGEDRFYLDCRILPDVALEDVIGTIQGVVADVEKEFGVRVELAFPQKVQAAPATRVDAPIVIAVSEAIRAVRNIEPKPMGIGGGTVAALFRSKGIPAVVWSTMDDLAHQPDEYCVVDNLVEDTKVFAHVYARKISEK